MKPGTWNNDVVQCAVCRRNVSSLICWLQLWLAYLESLATEFMMLWNRLNIPTTEDFFIAGCCLP